MCRSLSDCFMHVGLKNLIELIIRNNVYFFTWLLRVYEYIVLWLDCHFQCMMRFFAAKVEAIFFVPAF